MDFGKVLMVGIVVFALLVIFFGGEIGLIVDDEDYEFEPDDNVTDDVDVEEEPFYVGRKQESDYSYFMLSDKWFEVSFGDAESEIGYLTETTIERSLFRRAGRTFRFNLTDSELDKIKGLNLETKVQDTNSFGELNIYFNDKEILSEFVNRGAEIELDLNISELENSNSLRFEAGRPGLHFWAPTTYILEDLRISAESLEREIKTFNFELDREKSIDFRKGRIILYPDEYSGEEPLVVRVNDQDVYRGTPDYTRTSYGIVFDDIDMREGINSIEMFTHQDSSYSFYAADLVYFWGDREEEPYYKSLDVGETEYDRLPGEIRFTVDRVIESPETLYLVIVNPFEDKSVLHIEKPIRDGTEVSLELTQSEIDIGVNEIQFIVEGEGGYHIKDFEVDL